jgi:hypothetical protein
MKRGVIFLLALLSFLPSLVSAEAIIDLRDAWTSISFLLVFLIIIAVIIAIIELLKDRR